MKHYDDTWCKPLYRKNEKPLYGGAARNYRIKANGGMNAIIARVIEMAFIEASQNASAFTLEEASTRRIHRTRRTT